MALNGHALEEASSIEVIAAYSAGISVLQGVAATPGWHSVGMFFLPRSVADIRLEVIGMVSAQGAGLSLNARLFSISEAAVVSGSGLTITETDFIRRLSGKIALEGQRQYMIQAECVGGAALADFAIVKTATITD